MAGGSKLFRVPSSGSMASVAGCKELNILILGETGVGKSTWINGFVNFLSYDKLDLAMKGELFTLIPTEFVVSTKDLRSIVVKTGTDKNEVHQAGQAATQECKVYKFQVGHLIVKLIDTPGMGDPRGVEQDKKNFENILGTLTHLKDLHGICILLKPNNARLTITFRYCIKELLTYLHRGARQNIIFCYTNTRGTFYRPGDTHPALEQLLTENADVQIPLTTKTVYCFDSEAYRFLAAVKNKEEPVKFPDSERENFAKSWEQSIAETKRMLQHIMSLQPHTIHSMLNLNHARQIVIQLTRPLAEITKNIQLNKEVIKDHIEEIARTENNIKDLQAKRFCPQKQIEVIKLDYPKTVCSNSECTSIYGDDSFKQTDYRTICHDHCYLQGVEADCIGHPSLINCAAMGGTKSYCVGCSHSYREHLHVYYDSKVVSVQVENKTTQDMISQKMSATEIKQRMIDDLNDVIAQHNGEQAIIEETSAKFACFLKHNAILPYDDAMLEYLDHLIREESQKANFGGNRRTMEGLIHSRESYRQQIQLLEKEIARGGAESAAAIGTEDVDQLVKDLQNLPLNGKVVTDALNAIRGAHAKTHQYQEVTPPLMRKGKGPGRLGRGMTAGIGRGTGTGTGTQGGGGVWERMKAPFRFRTSF